jgi:hypothetical protein
MRIMQVENTARKHVSSCISGALRTDRNMKWDRVVTVDGDCHELSIGARIPEIFHNRGNSCCEPIHADGVGPEDNNASKDFPILECREDVVLKTCQCPKIVFRIRAFPWTGIGLRTRLTGRILSALVTRP